MTVILAAACRTPFVAANGALAGWHPVDLSALVLTEAIERADLSAEQVDEVWVGCAEPVGAQGAGMARAAVLAAGWPDRIGGTVVDRAETSGSAALHGAAAAIAAGTITTAVVLGVCSASIVQPGASALGRTYGRPWGDGPAARMEDRGGLLPPARAAEVAALAAGFDRDAQDRAGIRSHELRAEARSIAMMTIDARPGERSAVQRGAPVTVDAVRTLPDDPSAAPPSFEAAGTVTAMTFAPPVDGVAAIVLTAGGDGRAELVGVGRAAGDPLDPAGGVDVATARALATAAIDSSEIAWWEIVEATAAGLLVICDQLGLDPDTVNPAGGTLGVGDAGAAEELRLSIDGISAATDGQHVAAVSAGTTGSAVTIWRRTVG